MGEVEWESVRHCSENRARGFNSRLFFRTQDEEECLIKLLFPSDPDTGLIPRWQAVFPNSERL